MLIEVFCPNCLVAPVLFYYERGNGYSAPLCIRFEIIESQSCNCTKNRETFTEAAFRAEAAVAYVCGDSNFQPNPFYFTERSQPNIESRFEEIRRQRFVCGMPLGIIFRRYGVPDCYNALGSEYIIQALPIPITDEERAANIPDPFEYSDDEYYTPEPREFDDYDSNGCLP